MCRVGGGGKPGRHVSVTVDDFTEFLLVVASRLRLSSNEDTVLRLFTHSGVEMFSLEEVAEQKVVFISTGEDFDCNSANEDVEGLYEAAVTPRGYDSANRLPPSLSQSGANFSLPPPPISALPPVSPSAMPSIKPVTFSYAMSSSQLPVNTAPSPPARDRSASQARNPSTPLPPPLTPALPPLFSPSSAPTPPFHPSPATSYSPSPVIFPHSSGAHHAPSSASHVDETAYHLQAVQITTIENYMISRSSPPSVPTQPPVPSYQSDDFVLGPPPKKDPRFDTFPKYGSESSISTPKSEKKEEEIHDDQDSGIQNPISPAISSTFLFPLFLSSSLFPHQASCPLWKRTSFVWRRRKFPQRKTSHTFALVSSIKGNASSLLFFPLCSFPFCHFANLFLSSQWRERLVCLQCPEKHSRNLPFWW